MSTVWWALSWHSIIDYNNDNIITYIDIISCNLFCYLLKELSCLHFKDEKTEVLCFFFFFFAQVHIVTKCWNWEWDSNMSDFKTSVIHYSIQYRDIRGKFNSRGVQQQGCCCFNFLIALWPISRVWIQAVDSGSMNCYGTWKWINSHIKLLVALPVQQSRLSLTCYPILLHTSLWAQSRSWQIQLFSCWGS